MTRDVLRVRRRPGDLETPVSAMLKLGADTAGSFLFESIHGGERLGRYSFIGLLPQRWMRVLNGIGEQSDTLAFDNTERFDGSPVDALRAFAEAGLARTRVVGVGFIGVWKLVVEEFLVGGRGVAPLPVRHNMQRQISVEQDEKHNPYVESRRPSASHV